MTYLIIKKKKISHYYTLCGLSVWRFRFTKIDGFLIDPSTLYTSTLITLIITIIITIKWFDRGGESLIGTVLILRQETQGHVSSQDNFAGRKTLYYYDIYVYLF